MKLTLFALALIGAAMPVALAAPSEAPIAPAPTFCNPDPDVDTLEAFLRLPPYVFRYFGISDPSSLTEAKGLVRDDKNGYIAIPYAGNSQHPDRAKMDQWQMRLFRTSAGAPVAVVASTTLAGTQIKPFIHVFRFKDGYPYRTTAKDWPYKLNSQNGEYYQLNLPNTGNVISSALPQSDVYGYFYRWTGRKFARYTPTEKDLGNY